MAREPVDELHKANEIGLLRLELSDLKFVGPDFPRLSERARSMLAKFIVEKNGYQNHADNLREAIREAKNNRDVWTSTGFWGWLRRRKRVKSS